MFDYIIERVRQAPLEQTPFPHLYLPDLFESEHFEALIGAREIALGPFEDDDALFAALDQAGFDVLDFPNCMTDIATYKRWHARGEHGASDGPIYGEFGMVFRLAKPETTILSSLTAFLGSDAFLAAICARFDVDAAACIYDGGIQKYLDGYRITPHPDIRRKALTWMVNIVPDPECATREYHTQYMRLKPQYAYVASYWAGNDAVERCHLPWDVAENVWMHRQNNSLVAFAPGNDSLHAVSANYDHLAAQRTQIYGNMWFKHKPVLLQVEWPSLAITPQAPDLGKLARMNAPLWLRAAVRTVRSVGRPQNTAIRPNHRR